MEPLKRAAPSRSGVRDGLDPALISTLCAALLRCNLAVTAVSVLSSQIKFILIATFKMRKSKRLKTIQSPSQPYVIV